MAMLKANYIGEEKSATQNDIRTIAGPLDEEIVAAILNTDATCAEVRQALDWLEESYYTLSAFVKPMNDHVRSVYEILDYAGYGLGRKRYGRS